LFLPVDDCNFGVLTFCACKRAIALEQRLQSQNQQAFCMRSLPALQAGCASLLAQKLQSQNQQAIRFAKRPAIKKEFLIF
jgi:hypothetical protein